MIVTQGTVFDMDGICIYSSLSEDVVRASIAEYDAFVSSKPDDVMAEDLSYIAAELRGELVRRGLEL